MENGASGWHRIWLSGDPAPRAGVYFTPLVFPGSGAGGGIIGYTGYRLVGKLNEIQRDERKIGTRIRKESSGLFFLSTAHRFRAASNFCETRLGEGRRGGGSGREMWSLRRLDSLTSSVFWEFDRQPQNNRSSKNGSNRLKGKSLGFEVK